MESRGRFLTVLIASPVTTVRLRVSKALKTNYIICQTKDATQLEASIIKFKPSILLMDVSLPKLKQKKTLEQIRHISFLTKVIILTPQLSEEEGFLYLKAGARGYLLRNEGSAVLSKVVQMVQKGEMWAGRSMMVRLIDELRKSNSMPKRYDKDLRLLSRREREIAVFIEAGKTNKEIGDLLSISEATVKGHLTKIFQKFGVTSRLELAHAINSTK